QGRGIRADLSTSELVDVFDQEPMEFAPGAGWSYSNSGYVLLGAILEEASGMSYPEYVETQLFEPLGMSDSHYGGRQLIQRRVNGYEGADGEYRNARFLSMTQPHAAGSLLSTVDDLARWTRAVMAGEVVSLESVARMTTKTELTDGEIRDYGYGYQLGELRGERMIHHGGGIFGFSTHALWLPDSKIFAVVLSNSPSNAVTPSSLSTQLAAHALGKPFQTFTAIELDPELLAEYVGVYRVDESSTRSVLLEDGRLYTQRAGSERFEVLPHAEDAVFYSRSLSHLKFVRDADGRVSAMHFFPEGAETAQVAEKISETVETAPSRDVAEVSPELYDLWVGTYEIAPGFLLEIRREGDRLISQATGQGSLELYPASVHRYFVREVEAELEFEPGPDGRAQAVTLFQAGREIRAERAR
ncbi:MAG: serine hydrolase, partial [Acidobacteriota bacterium]